MNNFSKDYNKNQENKRMNKKRERMGILVMASAKATGENIATNQRTPTEAP